MFIYAILALSRELQIFAQFTKCVKLMSVKTPREKYSDSNINIIQGIIKK